MTDETTTEQLAEIEGQPQPVQVREGRWRTRGGKVKDVTAMPTDHVDFSPAYPWWDCHTTWSNNGTYSVHENAMDLVEYLGPIEPDKTQELPEYTPPEGWRVVRFGESLQPGDVWVNQDGTEQRSNVLQWGASAVSGGRCIRRIGPQPEPVPDAAAIEELRSEVSYVQRLLGESRQRVTQLEELVTSLRTINDAQEKAFERATKGNDRLALQLEAVKAELVTQVETSRRLQIELDAAQQVPADSPELRQLRAELAEVTRERDQYLDSYQRIFGDLETIRETTAAETVEAVLAWLEPIRLVDNPNLANETLQHLPQIMRHLTGLDSHAID